MKKIAIVNGTFITMEDHTPLLTNATLIIENDTIIALGKELPPALLDGCAIVDGSHKAYLPGLVNTHSHTAMTLLRGHSDDVELNTWFSHIWPIEEKFDDNTVKWGNLLAIAEMLKSGTTCFVDMYDRMDQVAYNVEQTGIRASLARGIIGLCSKNEWMNKVQEARDFSRNWHQTSTSRITTMMAPHAPYTCPPEVMEKIVETATDLNLPIHTHLSETLHEVETMEKLYGMRPIDYLEKHHILSRPCLLAHAVHVNDEEIDKLAFYNAHISHNPISNLKLASGIAPLQKFLAKNILVSLGTDSPASNNNLDLLEEIKMTALLHKGVLQNPTAVPALEALKMGTTYGARSLWLENVGMLKPGMKADIIAINIDQPHLYPKANIISHLVYSASARDVTDAWVDGEQLLKDKHLTTIDEEQVKFEFKQCWNKLF